MAETIALVASAKVYLALWSNGKLSAAFEYLADLIATQHHDELMGKTTSEYLLAILGPAALVCPRT